MKVILHIGSPKTGTTSIQTALAQSRAVLNAQNIVFPTSLGQSNHIDLYCFASEGPIDGLKRWRGLRKDEDVAPFRARTEKAFHTEIAAMSPEILILSNEHCSARLTGTSELERIKLLLSPYTDDIEVFYYIRSQWELLVSSYATYIKFGGTEKFQFPSDDDLDRKYNYRRIIELWSSVFGSSNVKVRRYGPNVLKDGDVVFDFTSMIGVENYITPVSRQNKSLDENILEFVRNFNIVVPRTNELGLNPLRGNIQNLIEKYVSSAPFSPGSVVIDEMVKWSRPVNRWISENLFDGSPLFEEPASACELKNRDEQNPLELAEAFRIFGFIWERKQDEANAARGRVDRKR
jgi:hypothetical protein